MKNNQKEEQLYIGTAESEYRNVPKKLSGVYVNKEKRFSLC